MDAEEPLHLANPRSAQDLPIGFAMRSPIALKAQDPATEEAKLDGFLGARLAHSVVVRAALRITRFRWNCFASTSDTASCGSKSDPSRLAEDTGVRLRCSVFARSSAAVAAVPPADVLLQRRGCPFASISSPHIFATSWSTSTVCGIDPARAGS